MTSKEISLKSNWNSLYVAGEWIDNGDNNLIKDQNPYTGEVIAEVPSATAEDVDRAFDVAVRVQKENLGRTPQDLAKPILDGINVILANRDDIVQLLVAESGSTITKALFEIESSSVPMMQEASSFPFRSFGETMTSEIPGKENVIRRQPIGVVR
jgi:aldehyde dehydrogenase (NAD+)